MMYTSTLLSPVQPQRSSVMIHQVGLVLMVLVAHLAVFSVFRGERKAIISQPEISINLESNSTVTLVAPKQLQQSNYPVRERVMSPVVHKVEAGPEPAAEASKPVVEHVAEAATVSAAPAATEPDYKASYLSNIPPSYPLAARRMGMQGRVMLQVEVLAAGTCGNVSIQQSSGFPLLDKAAMEAVKAWRFIPATQAGRAIDKWFMIPIHFSLKEHTA